MKTASILQPCWPRLSTGISRGNKLTNGQRWNGKGTKVKVHEAGVAGNRLLCLIFCCFKQWDPRHLTAFQQHFPLQHKFVNWENSNSEPHVLNDNLAFKFNTCTNIALVWDNAREMSVLTLSDTCYCMNNLNETKGGKKSPFGLKITTANKKMCPALANAYWFKLSHFLFSRALEYKYFFFLQFFLFSAIHS